MDILLIVIIIIATLIIIGLPLVNAKRYHVLSDGILGAGPFEDLYNERDRALDALRDLQVEHTIGKISDADYTMLKARYDSKAAAALQQIDALEANHHKKESRKGTHQKNTNACPRCHGRIETDDKFCFNCGYKL